MWHKLHNPLFMYKCVKCTLILLIVNRSSIQTNKLISKSLWIRATINSTHLPSHDKWTNCQHNQVLTSVQTLHAWIWRQLRSVPLFIGRLKKYVQLYLEKYAHPPSNENFFFYKAFSFYHPTATLQYLVHMCMLLQIRPLKKSHYKYMQMLSEV